MGNKNSKPEKSTYHDSVSEAVGEKVKRYVDTVLEFGEKRLVELETELAKGKKPTPETQGDTTDPDPRKPPAGSILAKFEDWELKQLGLGRGVDGTNPRPWVNKSPFQVRNPIIAPPGKNFSDETCNLSCTDEGGLVQDFQDEVTTIREQTAKIDLSITVPSTPLTVGAGADMSRKLTTKQNAYGKRVYSETIAFKPVGGERKEIGLGAEVLKFAGIDEEKYANESSQTPEERESAAAGAEEPVEIDSTHRGEPLPFNPSAQSLPGYDLERRLLNHYFGGETVMHGEESSEIKKLEPVEEVVPGPVGAFYNFLKRYRITHYVSSITLGASAFILESEEHYEKRFSPKGSVGYAPIISTKEASLSFVKKVESKSKDIQQVGEFKKDGKGKLTYEIKKKAVVEVKLEPLTSLFQNEILREAMKTALKCFIEEERRRKEGPFLISCNDGKIFWKVEENEQGHALLYATDNKTDASEFYILLTDENFDFYIGWQKPRKDKTSNGTMRYLQAQVSICGRNDGPLCFESRGNKQNSLFAINARFEESFYIVPGEHGTCGKNVNPEIWFDAEDRNRESFLIRCVKRKGRVDGFVAVARNQQPEAPEAYRTITRTNAGGHDNRNIFMAFRLHEQKKCNPCLTGSSGHSGASPVRDGVADTSC